MTTMQPASRRPRLPRRSRGGEGRAAGNDLRDRAVERLIAALQAATPAERMPLRRARRDGRDPRARLHAAHAAYALSAGVMRQAGAGAWLRLPAA